MTILTNATSRSPAFDGTFGLSFTVITSTSTPLAGRFNLYIIKGVTFCPCCLSLSCYDILLSGSWSGSGKLAKDLQVTLEVDIDI